MKYKYYIMTIVLQACSFYDGVFPHNKKVQFTKLGKKINSKHYGKILQNGSSGENSYLQGKLRNIPVLVMGKIYGEKLEGKFAGKIWGKNLRGKFAGKM